MLTTIRARMLVATLAPIVLIVLVLVGVFSTNRLGELGESHNQRGKLLLRQVALSSEFGLFSGNIASLQAVVNGVKRESDVRSVAVFDAAGVALASAGTPLYLSFKDIGLPRIDGNMDPDVETLVDAVKSGRVQLDDLFTQQKAPATTEPEPVVLGYAVVEFSKEGLKKRQQDMLQLALGVGLLGLLLAGFLAIQLGEGVVQPILRVSRMISQVGQGDLMARITETPGDPLYELQVGLNQMATRLAWGREELEQRVASVTAELREKKNEAEEATRAKTRFLAAASHDLRQPTHALGMFVARLGQLPLDEQTRHLVGNVEASVQAMQDLLDDLLDVSRLDAGAVQVNLQPVELDRILINVRNSLGALAIEKGLKLRIRHSTLWAKTDPVLLQRILMNLVHNALRYTQQGSVLVACRSANQGQGVRLEVWDSGIGISPEHQADIFKEFYQVGNAGRDRAYGLGLGLNIVERSAALLEHPLKLWSVLGRGTRFSLTLPRIDAPEGSMETATVAANALGTLTLNGTTVLVLEDDEFARDAVSNLMQSWGCTVWPCATTVEALEALRSHSHVDVILSDYRLAAGDNGLMAINRLRAFVGKPVAACLMSGDTDSHLMQAARDANLPLLHKPVRPAKLRNVLRRMLMSHGAGASDLD